MITSGRTGTIKPVQIDGVSYFLKRNEDPFITELERGMYEALRADFSLARRGVTIPNVLTGPERTSFYVEDCGPTYSDYLHSGIGQDDLASLPYIKNLLSVRRDVNRVVNATLTDADKKYLCFRAQEQLKTRTVQLMGCSVGDSELEKHRWAYRVMGALGVADSMFKELYTSVVGSMLDSGLSHYGMWLTDNCIRNNTIGNDGVGVIPIDFNSVRYGLKQMDEGAVLGMYLFDGPVALRGTDREDIIKFVCGTNDGIVDKEYYDSLMASMLHTHAMLAGYRTTDAHRLFVQLVDDVSNGRFRVRDQEFLDGYLAFRSAFDEIEYHSAVVDFIARDEYASFGSERRADLSRVASTLDLVTFDTRCLFIPHALFQEGQVRLWRSRESQ